MTKKQQQQTPPPLKKPPNNNVLCYRSVPEMDWQPVASYFTVKSTDIFYSVEY